MNCTRMLGGVGIVICLLAACGPTITKTTQVTEIVPADTLEPTPLPLSEPGPYGVGMRKYSFTDAARNDREVTISVYYPAVQPSTPTSYGFTRDADPDPREAPYPLILSSTKVARTFAPYLVSHGFTWASIDKIDYYIPWDENLFNQPLDILFALNQIASNPLEGLDGMIDADHAGAMGYSFDGYNALALSGARVDPEFYLTQCAQTPLKEHWIKFGYCNPSAAWDQFAAHAGDAVAASDDGLWKPMTSERIRAVMPMAPEGAALFGERGLVAVDRPTLIIGATEDVDCVYKHEAVYIFEHIGTTDKTLISFVGQDHYMIFEPEMVSRMAHFAVAFFGYYLQGRENYAEYFSEDFVAQYNDLDWGVHEK